MTVMAVATRDNRVIQLLKKLGVNTSEAVKCSIIFEPDSIVIMRVDYQLSFDNLEVLEKHLKIDAENATKKEEAFNDLDKMVGRFLGWKLPEDFCPDAGISFKPEYNVEYMAKQGKPPMRHEPIGTNLFTADQAREMIKHILEM